MKQLPVAIICETRIQYDRFMNGKLCPNLNHDNAKCVTKPEDAFGMRFSGYACLKPIECTGMSELVTLVKRNTEVEALNSKP